MTEFTELTGELTITNIARADQSVTLYKWREYPDGFYGYQMSTAGEWKSKIARFFSKKEWRA